MIGRLFRRWDLVRIVFTVSCLYFLAPNLDRRMGFVISLTFALLNILAAHLFVHDPRGLASVEVRKRLVRAVTYVGISMGTYYILFNDQPWNALFQTGLFAASSIPLIVCSMIMSLAGGLLLKGWNARIYYILITLGLQIPIGLLVGGEQIQQLFTDLSHAFHYDHQFLESWAIWQFEWMVTYHVPFYFLSRWSQRQNS